MSQNHHVAIETITTASFSLFGLLPPELRVLIWKLSLSPRVVRIDYNSELGFYPMTSLPPIVKVCKEAFRAVGPLYPRVFGTYWRRPVTRVNFEIDIIYLPSEIEDAFQYFFYILSERERREIRHLAVDQDSVLESTWMYRPRPQYIPQFIQDQAESLKSLETFYEVMDLAEYGSEIEGIRFNSRSDLLEPYIWRYFHPVPEDFFKHELRLSQEAIEWLNNQELCSVDSNWSVPRCEILVCWPTDLSITVAPFRGPHGYIPEKTISFRKDQPFFI